MKRFAWILAACAALAATAMADELKDARKAIGEQYQKIDRAYVEKNVGVIGGMFVQDCKFRMNGEGQTLRTPVFLQGTKALLEHRDVTMCKTTLKSVKKVKDGFLATSTWVGESKPAKNSKEMATASKKAVKQTLMDTWKKTPAGWRIVNRLVEQ